MYEFYIAIFSFRFIYKKKMLLNRMIFLTLSYVSRCTQERHVRSRDMLDKYVRSTKSYRVQSASRGGRRVRIRSICLSENGGESAAYPPTKAA